MVQLYVKQEMELLVGIGRMPGHIILVPAMQPMKQIASSFTPLAPLNVMDRIYINRMLQSMIRISLKVWMDMMRKLFGMAKVIQIQRVNSLRLKPAIQKTVGCSVKTGHRSILVIKENNTGICMVLRKQIVMIRIS